MLWLPHIPRALCELFECAESTVRQHNLFCFLTMKQFTPCLKALCCSIPQRFNKPERETLFHPLKITTSHPSAPLSMSPAKITQDAFVLSGRKRHIKGLSCVNFIPWLVSPKVWRHECLPTTLNSKWPSWSWRSALSGLGGCHRGKH